MIGACLDSLSRQIEQPFEIIVVDNGSQDQTALLARPYNGVRVVRETRVGTVFARNAGFDEAKGDIIARCDADCRLPTDWTARIVANMARSNALAVTGPALFYDVPPWMQSKVSRIHQLAYFGHGRRTLGHEVLFGSNMAITKAAWEKTRNGVCVDETTIHEDIDLAIHVSRSGTILFDPCLRVLASLRGARAPLPQIYSRLRRWRTTRTSHSDMPATPQWGQTKSVAESPTCSNESD
jgi:glycosyltransferase involved in cell wall biosynthesis